MKELIFSDYRDRIITALQSKADVLGLTEETTLVDGFITHHLQNKLTGDLVIGGPVIPVVVLLGKKSGRLYYFALRALIPSADL